MIFEDDFAYFVDKQIDDRQNGQILYPGLLDYEPELGLDFEDGLRIVEQQLNSKCILLRGSFVFDVAVRCINRI